MVSATEGGINQSEVPKHGDSSYWPVPACSLETV